MDQTPTGTQLPNGVQSPTENSATREIHCLPKLRIYCVPELRTPLGEPMNHLDAAHLALNPIGWHMAYWLNIFYTGVYRGEHVMLMVLRIEYEISKIPDVEIANKLGNVWIQRRSFIEEEGQRILQGKSPRNEISERYFRDVDRMLVDKKEKTRAYLLYLKTLKDTSLQAGNIERASEVCERVRDLYEIFDDETIEEMHR